MWIIGAWLFPVISACMWLGMLLAMLIDWAVHGERHYPSMSANQDIAYISDVGAFGLKPLFITGSVITTVFLDLGILSERWLRHTGRLAPNTSTAQKILSGFAILFAIIGSAGLICLSIFDTYHHPRVHDGCLLAFIGGYIICAIFLCAEYQRLGIHYRDHRVIRISFWVKLIFIIVEAVLAIVFVATNFTNHANPAAIFEWIIAFIFTFWVLSFLLDLLPSVRTKHHVPQGEKHLENGHTNQNAGYQYEAPLTNDSAGPNNENVNAGYRGTTMEGTANGYPQNHNDLGRQQKKGFGRLHF